MTVVLHWGMNMYLDAWKKKKKSVQNLLLCVFVML